MDQSKVVETLKQGVALVHFTKVNGETREMTATLSEELLPEIVSKDETQTAKKRNVEALAVWDTVAEGWRSFRWDSLKTVNGVEYIHA